MIDITGARMTTADWASSEFFKETEDWGDPSMISRELVEALNAFRRFIGKPAIIHCGTQGKHTPGSFHYRGESADLHIVGMDVWDQFLAASRFVAFRGLGVYPHWNNPGLHVDVRALPYHAPRARWMCDKSGVYVNIESRSIKHS